ncbi:AAA family ATPase [Pseudomonas putida]
MTPIRRPQCPDFLFPFLADYGPDHPKTIALIESLGEKISGIAAKATRHHGQLRDLLSEVFHNRCCYCEVYADPASSGVIERFRPKAMRPSRESADLTYWHLQLDWRNLYWACATCNRYKADRFFLQGDAARPGMPYLEIVEIERPVLLDPCRDAPDEHLIFKVDGSVEARSDRGWATIKLFDLNRRQLVLSRSEQAKLFASSTHAEQVARAEGSTPHCAVWRQLLRNSYRAIEPPERFVGELVEPSIDTESGIGVESYRAISQYITRVQIRNYGPIHHLDLDLSQSLSEQAPCFALLGENGVGKSTVLRALALALSGKAYAKRLKISSNKLLSAGAYEGEVRVSVVGAPQDIVVAFRRSKALSFSNEHSRSLVLAYGATRLLPRGRHRPKPGLNHAKIDNLFDPFLPLTAPEEWLSRLDPERLEEVNQVLASLMPHDHSVKVIQGSEGGELSLEVGGAPGRRVSHLSDGYQSMLGMAVDIMQVLYRFGSDIEATEGVVLIDELGNHFHPAWRLQCLSALRTAFPRTQFIYSTHDPLCLRGLSEGEVAVLRRDRLGHVYALEDLPPVAKLRVEQLLSSEHFGLRSTVDPQLEADIKEYETLLGTPNRTEEHESRLKTLVKELTDQRYLGATKRERLALQLLDSSGSEELPAMQNVSAEKLSKATVARLRFIMQEAAPKASPDEVSPS